MCSIDRVFRVVSPPKTTGRSFIWADERNTVVTIAELTDEILSFQQTSPCPIDCAYCGNKKGQLPPVEFTFVESEDASLWANQLVSCRCQITTTKHRPSSIGYHANEYHITAYGYTQQEFWMACLAPLMKRVQLSSIPHLLLDWSHVQVLELRGKFPTASSSTDGGDATRKDQNLFTPSEAQLLRTILVSPTCQIFHLELCWCAMDTAGLFWDAIAQCPTLSILTLKDCDLSGTPLSSSNNNDNNVDIELSDTGQDIQPGCLQELTIQGSFLDEHSLDSLCCLLQNRNATARLQHVTMVNNDWPIDAADKVVTSLLVRHTQLETLDLTGLDTDDNAIHSIGQLMKSSSSLQKLNLAQCPNVIDARPLADGLMGSTLIELDLSNNRLIHMGTLAMALQDNQSLHTLNLSKTKIDDDTDDDSDETNENSNCSTFFANLGNTRGLKVLALDEVELSIKDAEDLAQSVRINTSLDALHLTNMGGSISWKSIFESLLDNKTLRSLQIGHNRFAVGDVNMLVAAMCINRSLRSLTLSGCDLRDEHLIMLGERMPDMQGLEDLDLSFNSFGAKGVMTLWQGLSSNFSIHHMSLFNSAYSCGGPKTWVCEGYAKENELIQDLVQRNRDAASTSRMDGKESTPH